MKLCDHCKEKNATVHYQETIGGITKEWYLCPQCAAKQQGAGQDLFTSLFPGLFPGFASEEKKVREEEKCPRCGTLFSQVRRKGAFGCAGCYDAFASKLDMTPFVGSAYRGGRLVSGEEKNAETKEEAPKKTQLSELKELLRKAVSEERYEEAAKLRDQIRWEEKA